jgi:transcriptional regulator with XRE-family HTH domain
MSSVGEILRKAREEKGLSLDEIASATRINKKFLAELEQGTLTSLPQTYVNAFIRTYAKELGIDPESLRAEVAPAIIPEEKGTEAKPVQAEVKRKQPKESSAGSGVKGNPVLVLAAVLIVAVISFAALIEWMRSEKEQKPVEQMPFSEILRERKPEQVTRPIAVPESSFATHGAHERDSLLLEGVASDSVWVRIVRDDNPAQEYTFAPGIKMDWKARDYFILSLGNATAITFKLNGKSVGALGKVKKPLQDVNLSWNTLDTLQKVAVKRTAAKSSASTQPDSSKHLPVTQPKNAGNSTAKPKTQQKKDTLSGIKH